MSNIEILIRTVMLLSSFGVIGGAIWLAILGKWSVLGAGLLITWCSVPLLGFALMPGILISLYASRFLGSRLWFLGLPLWLAGLLYSDVIAGAWCFTVVALFVKEAGFDATLPALLWAYGVAMKPLSYMATSHGPDSQAFTDVVIAAGAQVSVVVMGIVVLTKGLDFHLLIYACAVPMTVAALVQARFSFLALRKAALLCRMEAIG